MLPHLMAPLEYQDIRRRLNVCKYWSSSLADDRDIKYIMAPDKFIKTRETNQTQPDGFSNGLVCKRVSF